MSLSDGTGGVVGCEWYVPNKTEPDEETLRIASIWDCGSMTNSRSASSAAFGTGMTLKVPDLCTMKPQAS